MISVIGLATLNQTVIAKQLDNWQLLPQPQRATEIFFNDPLNIPEVVRLGARHDIGFTLHNIEHELVTYRYFISAVSGNNNAAHVLKSDTVTLNHDQHRSVVEAIHIPLVSSPMALQVDLEYQGVGSDGKVGDQRQSIKYWVKVVGT